MCTARGVRQSSKSDAGARVEGSRTNFGTSRLGRFSGTAGSQIPGRIHPTGSYRWALGIAVAYAATKLMLHLAFQTGGPNNYVPISATPSLPVLLFTLSISVLTGVIF